MDLKNILSQTLIIAKYTAMYINAVKIKAVKHAPTKVSSKNFKIH